MPECLSLRAELGGLQRLLFACRARRSDYYYMVRAKLKDQPKQRSVAFAIKAAVGDSRVKTFAFIAHKTMYGGNRITKGDTVFVFASENEGGRGLIAQGTVTSAQVIPKKRGIARQTPRVSIAVKRTALAKRPL